MRTKDENKYSSNKYISISEVIDTCCNNSKTDFRLIVDILLQINSYVDFQNILEEILIKSKEFTSKDKQSKQIITVI